jgi:hypothetical protein
MPQLKSSTPNRRTSTLKLAKSFAVISEFQQQGLSMYFGMPVAVVVVTPWWIGQFGTPEYAPVNRRIG